MCFKLDWKLSHVCKLNLSGSAGNMEPVRPRARLGTLMTKNSYDILHLMVMVTAKAFKPNKNTNLGNSVQNLEYVGHELVVACKI